MTDSTPHFEGNVDTRWLVHGGADREMELLSAFAFVDSTGYRWAAHPGEKIDGASIPDQVWSTVVGTPFIGDYRRASVVHDVACERHERTSREAHRMFYEAMLAERYRRRRARCCSIRRSGCSVPNGISDAAFVRCWRIEHRILTSIASKPRLTA